MADARLGDRLLAAMRLDRHERAVERAVVRAIHNQRAKAVALLRVVRADAIPANLFDDASWMDELDKTVRPEVEGIFAEIAGDARRFGTGPVQLPTIDLTRNLDRLLGSMRGLSKDISAALGRTLTEGVNRGESIDKLAGRVRDVFDGVGESRARQIARTETHGAAEGAGHDAAGALHRAGTSLEKTWLATHDARTRPDHLDADGQTVPYDQPFKVGGHALEYPGDPSGPVEQIVNCRCSTLFDQAGTSSSMTPPGGPPARPPSEFTADPVMRRSGQLVPLSPNTRVGRGVRTAKQAIDSVHTSPELTPSPISVLQTSGQRRLGSYSYSRSGIPMRIEVSTGGAEQAMTYAHEFGHFFDHQDWNNPGTFTSFLAQPGSPDPLLAWKRAIDASPTVQALRDLLRNPQPFVLPNGQRLRPDLTFVRYLLKPEEIFARSYAQWIATDSGDAAMLAELDGMRQGLSSYYGRQWPDAEFVPIRDAFRSVFRDAGLLK